MKQIFLKSSEHTVHKPLPGTLQIPVCTNICWRDNLKDYCKLGLLSSTIKEIAEKKGKEGKIKPRCSSAAILDWGEDTDAKKYLEENEFKK